MDNIQIYLLGHGQTPACTQYGGLGFDQGKSLVCNFGVYMDLRTRVVTAVLPAPVKTPISTDLNRLPHKNGIAIKSRPSYLPLFPN